MKTKIILSAFLAGGLSWYAAAQTSGGAGASTGVSAGQNGANANIGAQGNVGNGTLPPGLENREQLPPGLQNRETLPPGLAKRTNTFGENTNGFSSSNQLGQAGGTVAGTNQFGDTRQFGSNTFGWNGSPTNRLWPTGGTNSQVFSASNSMTFRDEAATPQDRALLLKIEQTIQTKISARGSALPVHFRINNGVVTLVGTVPSAEESRRILSLVQQVPGVTRIADQLQVGPSAYPNGNTLTPTGTSTGNGDNYNAGGETSTAVKPGPPSAYSGSGAYYYDNNPANFGSNLPPTSVTTNYNRRYTFPPGLDRENLPPGLQNRELPPGLQGRTNYINP